MSISADLDHSIRLQDVAHRPESTQQPVIFRHRLMRSDLISQLGCCIVENFRIIDDLLDLHRFCSGQVLI